MKRFNASKVRALGNLQGLSEKQKAFLRRHRGVKQRFAEDKPAPAFKASRDYLCLVKADYAPPKIKGRSHVRMGDAARAAMAARSAAREAFFKSLAQS